MSNTALCLTALLLLIPIFISYKEGLHIIKDLVIATIRATIQLLILGFLLNYIFEINEKWLLVLCVLVIIINASWNTISRASTRPFDYGTVITYPFVPHNWQATRYSDGLAYGVWYGALELETTVYETVYHWHRFVMDSFAGLDRTIAGERRVFDVRCEAILIDLRAAREPRLTDRRDYGFTWKVGRYLWERSQSGLLARSARAAGTTAAMFRPEPLTDVRDRCFLTYRMNPAQDRVAVERAPGTPWLEVQPSTLA